MLTRWIIRLVVIFSVLLLGAMADAQQSRGGGGSKGGGSSGGGSSAANSGGGGGSSAAPKGGGGNSSSTGSSANRGGTKSSGGSAPPTPPTPPTSPTPPRASGGGAANGTGSAISGTGSAVSGTGSGISGTGAPITGTPAPGGAAPGRMIDRSPDPRGARFRENPIPNPGDERRERRRRPRAPIDPNDTNQQPAANVPQYVDPQQYQWAPYTWWFRGNSYWLPPMADAGYYGGGYRDDEDDDDYYRSRGRYDEGRYDRVAPTPAAAAAPSAAQEQARSVNAGEGMPAYSQAMLEFKAAQSAYEAASERVLAKLREDPGYRRLVAQRDRKTGEVEAVQAGAKVPPAASGQVLSAAQEKLNVSSKVTRMEQDAIAADAEASAAKAKMVEANERLSALRKQAEALGARVQ